MYSHCTELPDEKNDREYWVEINYDYDPPEFYHPVNTGLVHTSGQFRLHSVKVHQVDFFDPKDGTIRLSLDRLVVGDAFDAYAFALVENEIDHWNQLADDMLEEVA